MTLGTGILDLHGMDITILIGEDTMGLVGATTTHRTMDGMVEDTTLSTLQLLQK